MKAHGRELHTEEVNSGNSRIQRSAEDDPIKVEGSCESNPRPSIANCHLPSEASHPCFPLHPSGWKAPKNAGLLNEEKSDLYNYHSTALRNEDSNQVSSPEALNLRHENLGVEEFESGELHHWALTVKLCSEL